MLSYIPVILVVGIHVGIRVPSSSVRVASAPVCAVCVAVGPGSLSGEEVGPIRRREVASVAVYVYV